jgi:two-component system CheB/CheR fusion protein
MVEHNNANSAADATARSSFPIASVGASAGGLAPTVELIRELGGEPGIAIVVIHHLDPTHESGLVEILSRATTLPVAVATEGARVERNHVYVVPPNADLRISQGVLKVVPRLEEGGLHLPIDGFCESLALDRDGAAVSVVLSGSGFDGTKGIKAVKREGGITLAQDATASFGSMPESAIATGCVDFILPPAGLARELVRIGAHALSVVSVVPRAAEEPEYARILAAMRKASGVDFASYKHSTIQRRVQRRLFLRGLADLTAYRELLALDPGEIGKLCEEVLIHVTGFFREPEAFEALRTQVFPKLCDNRLQGAPVRVWVPGCSTGEEVYSIAICLLEFMGEAHKDLPIKIFGTDLSLATIEKARAGRYPESVEHDVSSGRLQRFFTKDEAGYQIRRAVRDLCVFAKHDVTRDAPFSAMDLISCRNLMIYLGPELQDRVLALLHYALREPGFLVLGSSETVRAFAGFAAVDGKNKIYARTSGGSAWSRLAFDFTSPSPRIDFIQTIPSATLLDRAPGSGSFIPSDVYREADRPVLAESAPPGAEPADTAFREELATTRRYLESVIQQLEATNEELRAANEEIVSSNEELRSTNEELESAKEELQATNEELRTVNDELKDRNGEATRLTDDLTNVLTSVEIPILIVGRDLRLRRFTPAAGRSFGVLATDLDRPLSAARRLVEVAPALVGLIPDVVEHLLPAECAVSDIAGRRHHLSIRPYVTRDGRIDGAVIAARDVDAETTAAERLTAARKYAENIVETVREGLVVVDGDLRIRSANTAFLKTFRLAKGEIEGRRLDEVGSPELATPVLAKLLEGLGDGVTAEGFRMEHLDVDGSLRVFLLNARRIESTDLFLMAFEDATEAERARSLRADLAFRDALTVAAEGILIVDPAGRILFANPAATALFGYEGDELLGVSVDVLLPDGLSENLTRGRVAYPDTPWPRPMGPERNVIGRRKNGTDVALEVSLSTMTRESGPVVVAFVTDVTERRNAEREIRAYQERLQRMAFDAALTEERERRRLAIELHDWIVQDLALAQIKLAPVRSELAGNSLAALDSALELVQKAIDDSRTLVFDLSPPVLYDLGLKEGLAWLAEDVERRYGLKVEVTDDGANKPLDDATKTIAFRAVRELVMNVLKHARVPAAKVSLRRTDDAFHIDVVDGGVGFDPDAPTDRSSREGFGLLSVREQIGRVGGTLKITSASQQGTLVSVSVPLQTGDASRLPTKRPPGGKGAP